MARKIILIFLALLLCAGIAWSIVRTFLAASSPPANAPLQTAPLAPDVKPGAADSAAQDESTSQPPESAILPGSEEDL